MNEQRLTKRERKLLKKQQREEEHLRSIQRKKIKKILAIFLPALLVVGGIIFILINNSPETSQSISGIPKIEINHPEYDAGAVSMANGLVKHTYEIKNAGNGDLEINKIWTSCDCTSAVLTVGERKSPKFGMHINVKFWSQKIAPGETGFLEVIFDPAFHGPHGTGSVIREVYLSTNDPQNKETGVRLIADVVK